MAEWLGAAMAGWPAWAIIVGVIVAVIVVFVATMMFTTDDKNNPGLAIMIEKWRNDHGKR